MRGNKGNVGNKVNDLKTTLGGKRTAGVAACLGMGRSYETTHRTEGERQCSGTGANSQECSEEGMTEFPGSTTRPTGFSEQNM